MVMPFLSKAFFTFSVIGGHRQFSELLSHPVLDRRTGQAAAAAPVTVDQLTGRHKDCVPAVADTIPQYPAVFKKSRRGVHGITAVTPANPHGIAVFSFIVAEEYRGTRLNYDMLMSIMPELKANYDFVFIPVLHRLKTHQYWQRWGATEFYRDSECVYYKLETSR